MRGTTKFALILSLCSVQVCLAQYLTVRVSDNVQVLVTDKFGKKTGFDPSIQKNIQNIPSSGYSLEGVGHVGEEQNVETDNVYEVWIDDRNDAGPFSITVFGSDGGKYGLRIARGIENRFVLNLEEYITHGSQQEFSLEFSASNGGTLIKNIRANTLKENLEAIFESGDIGDEHFFKELMQYVKRFEDNLGAFDTLRATKELEQFQSKITKEYKKGIDQSPKRYIRPAAWKVLHEDAQSLIDRLPSPGKPEKFKGKK